MVVLQCPHQRSEALYEWCLIFFFLKKQNKKKKKKNKGEKKSTERNEELSKPTPWRFVQYREFSDCCREGVWEKEKKKKNNPSETKMEEKTKLAFVFCVFSPDSSHRLWHPRPTACQRGRRGRSRGPRLGQSSPPVVLCV